MRHFPGQRNGEKVEMILRKHWIIHVYALLRFLFIGIAPALIMVFLISRFMHSGNGFFDLSLAFLFAFLSFTLLYSLICWLNDDLDIVVVTNERVIDITQVTLLDRDTSEASLRQIQDVKGQIKGILGTILTFGTISVRTANDISVFELDHVHRPILNSSKIMSYIKTGAYIKVRKDESYKKHLQSSRKRILDALRSFFKN